MIATYPTSVWRVLKTPSLLFNSFFWFDVKYQIFAYFNPRQKWLTKTIPKTWCDKVTLIPHLLFECLIHFVDKERGIRYDTDWEEELKKGYITQEYVDSIKARDALLLEVYNYVKTERAALEIEHQNSYPKPLCPTRDLFAKNEDGNRVMRSCQDVYGMSFNEAYAETNRLEKVIAEKDMWAMNAIVKHYQYLWT